MAMITKESKKKKTLVNVFTMILYIKKLYHWWLWYCVGCDLGRASSRSGLTTGQSEVGSGRKWSSHATQPCLREGHDHLRRTAVDQVRCWKVVKPYFYYITCSSQHCPSITCELVPSYGLQGSHSFVLLIYSLSEQKLIVSLCLIRYFAHTHRTTLFIHTVYCFHMCILES
jgi:hypothetical protein